MGDYLTYAKITRRIPSRELMQLLDVADDGQIETVANDLIADVEAELLGYVTVRRAAPTAGESGMLAAIALRWFLWQTSLDRRSVNDDMAKAHDADIAWLEDYAEGKRSLGDAAEATQPGGTIYDADCRKFTRDKLKGF
jgi:phage gp36-like protein